MLKRVLGSADSFFVKGKSCEQKLGKDTMM